MDPLNDDLTTFINSLTTLKDDEKKQAINTLVEGGYSCVSRMKLNDKWKAILRPFVSGEVERILFPPVQNETKNEENHIFRNINVQGEQKIPDSSTSANSSQPSSPKPTAQRGGESAIPGVGAGIGPGPNPKPNDNFRPTSMPVSGLVPGTSLGSGPGFGIGVGSGILPNSGSSSIAAPSASPSPTTTSTVSSSPSAVILAPTISTASTAPNAPSSVSISAVTNPQRQRASCPHRWQISPLGLSRCMDCEAVSHSASSNKNDAVVN